MLSYYKYGSNTIIKDRFFPFQHKYHHHAIRDKQFKSNDLKTLDYVHRIQTDKLETKMALISEREYQIPDVDVLMSRYAAVINVD